MLIADIIEVKVMNTSLLPRWEDNYDDSDNVQVLCLQ